MLFKHRRVLSQVANIEGRPTGGHSWHTNDRMLKLLELVHRSRLFAPPGENALALTSNVDDRIYQHIVQNVRGIDIVIFDR